MRIRSEYMENTEARKIRIFNARNFYKRVTYVVRNLLQFSAIILVRFESNHFLGTENDVILK